MAVIRKAIAVVFAMSALALATPAPPTPWGPFSLIRDSVAPTNGQAKSIFERVCEHKALFNAQVCRVTIHSGTPQLELESTPGNLNAAYEFARLTYGHFTAKNREEALATLTFILGDGNWSDTVLLQKIGETYQPIRLEEGLDLSTCLRLPGHDGRDRLACTDAVFEPKSIADPLGADASERLVLLSFDGTKHTSEVVLKLPMSNLPICDNRSPFSLLTISSWNRRDVNRDGLVDLEVDVIEGRLRPPANYRCTKDASGVPRPNVELKLSAPKRHHLVFLWDGNHLKVAGESARLKAMLEAAK